MLAQMFVHHEKTPTISDRPALCFCLAHAFNKSCCCLLLSFDQSSLQYYLNWLSTVQVAWGIACGKNDSLISILALQVLLYALSPIALHKN